MCLDLRPVWGVVDKGHGIGQGRSHGLNASAWPSSGSAFSRLWRSRRRGTQACRSTTSPPSEIFLRGRVSNSRAGNPRRPPVFRRGRAASYPFSKLAQAPRSSCRPSPTTKTGTTRRARRRHDISTSLSADDGRGLCAVSACPRYYDRVDERGPGTPVSPSKAAQAAGARSSSVYPDSSLCAVGAG